jgi:molecular chaperone HscC
VDVSIFQGEARLVSDNVFLGKLSFPVERKRAGEVSLDVRFTYDVSGVLEAEVFVHGTEQRHRATITDNNGVLSQEEIDRKFLELAELKIHPREQSENRLLVAQADRLYEQSLGELRDFLAQKTAAFLGILETQDPARIKVARSQFKELLEHIAKDGAYL